MKVQTELGGDPGQANGQRQKVKVAQSCPTLCDPHGLYRPWNSPGQNTGVGSHSLLQGIFPTQGSNPGLPHCRQILYQLSHKGSPRTLEWAPYPFSRGSSWTRNQTGVSCIAGGFFTNWAIRGQGPIKCFWLWNVLLLLSLYALIRFNFVHILIFNLFLFSPTYLFSVSVTLILFCLLIWFGF